MAFGDRLRELRTHHGLTQENFAEELQVSRQAVSKWESGRGYPELEKILYICRRYGVGIDELFEGELPEKKDGELRNVPQTVRKPLRQALSDFWNNLAPYDKMVGGGLVLVGTLAVLALGRAMEGGGKGNMTLIWIAATIAFGIAEAATAGLVSIWFVFGSLAALLAAELGAALWLQIVVFLAVSVAALIATRPLAAKMLSKTIVATNADRVLHRSCRVTEEINNPKESGAVYVDGKTWSARSEDGDTIPEGTVVSIVRMEGVKLFVRKEN